MGADESKASNSNVRLNKKQVLDTASQTHFSAKEIEDLNAEFKKVDYNHSGGIDLQEFKRLFAHRIKSSTDENLESLFQLFDQNHK